MKTNEKIYGFLLVPAQILMWVATVWLRLIGKLCNVKIWPPIED